MEPVEEVILEHREDYVDVLEYCDAIYEDLAEEDVPEGARLMALRASLLRFLRPRCFEGLLRTPRKGPRKDGEYQPCPRGGAAPGDGPEF